MKKRGYTLLELIIVMAILVVLMPAAVKGSSVYNLIDNITVHSLKSDIANLISFAKHYSYNTGNTGRLEIDNIKGEISFVDTKNELTKNTIAKVTLPKGYDFLERFNISVSNKGVVSGDSIIFKSLSGEYHKVTISVGIDFVNIY
ncbi:type II secretion system protein [Clostridium sp. NSJ-6]|uniref:Type II secretion system protein n=1 Tax=Clostridium hominis TaxID=2763036 RepID=A0ABR7D809_9CLOT|nr:type II secretion system protein [Clostridium hominis]MBC5627504.1 type II secretion system protein [Clostridium hominis]MDU2672562.1 type II secretion system protein [Clostridium sp.]